MYPPEISCKNCAWWERWKLGWFLMWMFGWSKRPCPFGTCFNPRIESTTHQHYICINHTSPERELVHICIKEQKERHANLLEGGRK